MAPSASPKETRRRQSAPERPPSAGRHSAARTAVANRTRRNTVPPGPTSSNSVLANAPPNWTDDPASNTRSVGGIRSARSMAVHRTAARERTHEELERIFAEVDAPFAFVDLDPMWSNAAEMLGRARGTPLRVASKSVRCRHLLGAILDHDPGFHGLMTFTLPESLWLHEHGFDDLLLAYPTADRGALAELGRLDGEGAPILMVDSVEQLDLIEDAAGQPEALAREIVRRRALELAALMGYEAHIAGLGDRPLGKRAQGPAIRAIKRRSAAEIAERRAAAVAAVREVAPVPIVNGGGTGSIQTTREEEVVTEITAGSGFYAPTLFDRYASFSLTPAAMF